VRYIAVKQLARGWKDEIGIFEFLCDRAVNDPFECKYVYHRNPRYAAIEAIIKYYPHHAKTLLLLRDRAKNDPDRKVREFAQKKLNELGIKS
jgi:hypothetical protein